MSLNQSDKIRCYRHNCYLLNKNHNKKFQPIFLKVDNNKELRIYDLEKSQLVYYYWSSMTNRKDKKGDKVNNNEIINLKNHELRRLIKNNYFSLRYTLIKKDSIK